MRGRKTELQNLLRFVLFCFVLFCFVFLPIWFHLGTATSNNRMESLLLSSPLHLLDRPRSRSRPRPPHPRCFSVSSIKSSFLDFQEYVKPKRLLPSRGLHKFGKQAPDKLKSSMESDGSESLYKLRLRTSSVYGSGLSDPYAGVLFCIIDEHGDSILERIPAILHPEDQESGDVDHLHFHNGSVDEFMFWGPKLGHIQALWISLESGNWRLGDASLTALSICDKKAEESSGKADLHRGFIYTFEVEDIMIGEWSETGMAELRPCQISEYCGENPFTIPDISGEEAQSVAQRRKMNEDSMREYANLKYSQLVYDAILILAGTSISGITGGEETAVAYLTGGVCGFVYLELLQRTVDKLPGPEEMRSGKSEIKGGLLLTFALAACFIIVKHEAEPGFAPIQIVVHTI